MSKKPCLFCEDPSGDPNLDVTVYDLEQLRSFLGFKMCDAHQEQIEGAIILAGGEPKRLEVLPEIKSDVQMPSGS